MRTSIITSILLLFSIYAIAQSKFYLRSDFGVAKAIISSNIPDLTSGEYDAIAGFYIGYSVTKHIDIEVGVNYFWFSNSFTLKLDNNSTFSSMTRSSESAYVIVPLNAFYNIKLWDTKFTLKPHLGISYCSHTTQNQQYENITFDNFEESNNLIIINNVDSITSYKAKPGYNETLLINTGLGVEYALTKKFTVSVNTNYSMGINEVNRLGVLLKREDGNNLSGILSHNGSHFYTSCGVKLRF